MFSPLRSVLLAALIVAPAHAQDTPTDAALLDPSTVAAELRKVASAMASVDQLLHDLSSSDFAVREATTKRLTELPIVPVQKLQALAADADPETRFRIRQILAQPAPESTRLPKLVAAVHEQKIPALAAEVLTILEHSGDEKLRWSFEQALLTTSRPDDVKILAGALHSPVAAVRIASLTALSAIGTDAAIAALVAHENDTNEQAILARGEGLVRLNRREGLSVLIGLVTARDQAVRTRAALDLQSVTGRVDASLFAATDRDRRASAAAWRTWIAAQKDLRLRPLEATNTSVSPFED